MKNKYLPYLGVLSGIVGTALLSYFSHSLFDFFRLSSEHALIVSFFIISIIFILSFGIFHLSNKTVFPSFVIAIFFGMAAQPFLHPITEDFELLGVIVGLGATLILFGGGLETPFLSFRKLLKKIFFLSFFGLFVTAFLFSAILYFLSNIFSLSISLPVIILLGAILASTDPAAIIPILKTLRFKNKEIKDLIISESAVTDVTGTLLTVAFLTVIAAGLEMSHFFAAYGTIFSQEAGILLLKQISFGVFFGILGYFFLVFLTKFKENHVEEYEADAAFFLFVPIVIFTFALAFGGSGYLAAFIAGLLFTLTKHLNRSEHFFNHIIEGFFKPTIFILLGALVDLQSLFDYAFIGIGIALIFMFVIRPISVFFSIGSFSLWETGKKRLTVKELLFISFVRETGAIPAVLLVTVVSSGIPNLQGLVPIGMWVILLTLIIEPPLTPLVARFLKVATPIQDDKNIEIAQNEVPVVILGSRGISFVERLPFVVSWSTKRNIYRVLVLHCLENKYTEKKSKDIEEIAYKNFESINNERVENGLQKIDFSIVSRTGFLEKNIADIAKLDSSVTTIFVGRKILDFRLKDIKTLKVPFFFLD